ncbi:MAG TPA: hypothetical protein PKV41_05710, partial [Candidatus Omnitrophota bacterium]|nr:hypothetical protein [Candidatus Omnitrophota bacterium]
MRILKSAANALLVLCVSFSTATVALAENNAGFIFSREEEKYDIGERPDIAHAIRAFCEFLSLDSCGKTLKRDLASIKAYPGLTSGQRAEIFLLEDLMAYTESLRRRIDYLESKKNMLKSQLIASGYDGDMLSDDLWAADNGLFLPNEVFLSQQTISYGGYNPLARINSSLQDEKKVLCARIKTIQGQYDWLKTAKRTGRYDPVPALAQSGSRPDIPLPESFIKVRPPADLRADAPQKKDMQVYSGSSSKESADGTIALQAIDFGEKLPEEQNVRGFKKELIALYAQLDELEQRMEKENSKIDQLADQVIDLSLKLSETEIALTEKTQAIDSLKSNLTDVEQRFMLGQKIIQEKDREMQSLQRDLQMAHLDA